ncbi:hypothetical protein [Ekhidna sp.]
MKSTFLDNYFYQNPSFKVIREPQVSKGLSTLDAPNKTRELNFTVVHSMNGSTFELDKNNGIARIIWRGQVDIQTAKKLVSMGADSVEFNGYKKLLLDRSNLIEFETEARLWIRELLKTRAKKIVRKVNKLAIVKATTAKGSIFSNFIATAIKIVMPNLEMQEFNKEEEAFDWLV